MHLIIRTKRHISITTLFLRYSVYDFLSVEDPELFRKSGKKEYPIIEVAVNAFDLIKFLLSILENRYLNLINPFLDSTYPRTFNNQHKLFFK